MTNSFNLIGRSGVLATQPTILAVYINGIPYDNAIPILDARLIQKFGHHDRFIIRAEVPTQSINSMTSMTLWPDDVPIAIKWGRQPDIQTWYGYVNHKEVSSVAESGTNAPQITYVCIGTSAVLDPATNRKWENVSPTYMATQIAAENNLRAITTPSSTVLTYETQVGESNHQFLVRMAQKTGLRYWASGGTLYMIDPITAIQGIGQTAIPTFTSNKVPKLVDTCRHFQYKRGKNIPGSVMSNRVVYGLDAANGTPFSAVAPAPVTTKRTSINISYATQTASDANARVKAWANLSQFWIQASTQLYGSTNIYPSKLIQLVGNALADNAIGVWLVHDVEHSITLSGKAAGLDTFISTATIIRNTDQLQAVSMANTRPINPEFTTMTLDANGNWLSTNQSVVQLV